MERRGAAQRVGIEADAGADPPGARAPQSMLLAVPSDPQAQNWTLDELPAVVDEALALSRIRAVRPQDLQGLGLLLPGLFLSNNFHRDVPTVDFAAMLEKEFAGRPAARTAARVS